MEIDVNSRISTLLKHRPEALDVIVSINPKFEKLRNPILRKLMAGRTTIAMASKIGGCSPADFFSRLQPLGFSVRNQQAEKNSSESITVPGFMQDLSRFKKIILDARPLLDKDEDPLKQIQDAATTLTSEEVLVIINSFEPTPLRVLLARQGFESHAEQVRPGLVETYFYKPVKIIIRSTAVNADNSWDKLRERFCDNLEVVDVRQMEMPLPMLTILEALSKLPPGKALLVHHKRIPVFLFPQLTDRKFSYSFKKLSGTEVDLIIFRQQHEVA